MNSGVYGVYMQLMSTLGCHLCELAEAEIGPFIGPYDLQVEWLDIAEDDQLMQRYETRIPVLVHPSSGLSLDWPFDAAALVDFIQRCKGAP